MPKNIKVGIIGLGYVGLPLAIEFSKIFETAGFDKSKERILQLKKGIDKNKILNSKELKLLKKIELNNDLKKLNKFNLIIVCLPTPVTRNNQPNLKLIKSACYNIGKSINKKTTIVFESTVYPGVTEDLCIPIIEKSSGLKWKKDFFVGYSPERISPGKNYQKLSKIKKIISADNNKTLNFLKSVYSKIILAGLYCAPSIKVAEAAKILENTQRDVNIALMNEVSIIFNKLNINTRDVINAAKTKWNFGSYYPGLVGGHCIGVDPYYLSHKSLSIGHNPDLILASRKINEKMASHILHQIKKYFKKFKKKGKILVLGISYKEDCNDLRNSKVLDLLNLLKKNNISTVISDDLVSKKEFEFLTKMKLKKFSEINGKFDAIILSQPHTFYKKKINKIIKFINPKGIFFDLKSFVPMKKRKNIFFWEL